MGPLFAELVCCGLQAEHGLFAPRIGHFQLAPNWKRATTISVVCTRAEIEILDYF